MNKTEISRLKKLVYLSPITGLVIGAIYFLIKSKFNISFGFKDVTTLATIVAGFSFTMLGFLAAMTTFLFSLQKYKFFKRWLEDGNSEVFFTFFKVTIVCLFVTFASSLVVFTTQVQPIAFKLMMISLINNFIQLLVITILLVNKISMMKHSE